MNLRVKTLTHATELLLHESSDFIFWEEDRREDIYRNQRYKYKHVPCKHKTESLCYIDNWAYVSVKNRSYIYMRATFYLLKEGVHIQLEVLVVNSTPYSLLELLHHFLLV